jgi:hypothetical protein
MSHFDPKIIIAKKDEITPAVLINKLPTRDVC